MADGRYKMENCFALLIDNSEFPPESGLPPRVGAELDLPIIKAFCESACFYRSLETSNLSLVEIRQLLQDVIQRDFSEYDAVAIFISSHGIKGEIRTTDGGTITVQEIVSAFEGIATLQGKPKLFFTTNCLDEETLLREKARLVVPIYVPKTRDVLIAYASVDGYEYPKYPEEGSFAARALSEALRNQAFHLSLTEILALAFKKGDEVQGSSERKQIGTYVSTLREAVRFVRSQPQSQQQQQRPANTDVQNFHL